MTLPFLHAWDRSRYNPTWLCLCLPEEVVETAILEALAAQGILARKVDAGAKLLRGRAYGALHAAGRKDLVGRVMKGAAGAAGSGFADIVGVLPGGRALFIEAKAPEWLQKSPKTGKLIQRRGPGLPETEQLEFLASAHAKGAVVGVAWSVQDLDAILRGRPG